MAIEYGRMYGSLIAVRPAGHDAGHRALVECVCDTCGARVIRSASNVMRGTATCGRTDGPHTPLPARYPVAYSRYKQARKRCNSTSCPDYQRYGARGITFDFDNFEQYMNELRGIGWDESGGPWDTTNQEIDRIDNDAGYKPGNLRLASHKDNIRNSRSAASLTIAGTTRSYEAWAEIAGLSSGRIIRDRLARGWTTAEAIGVPEGKHRSAYI